MTEQNILYVEVIAKEEILPLQFTMFRWMTLVILLVKSMKSLLSVMKSMFLVRIISNHVLLYYLIAFDLVDKVAQ